MSSLFFSLSRRLVHVHARVHDAARSRRRRRRRRRRRKYHRTGKGTLQSAAEPSNETGNFGDRPVSLALRRRSTDDRESLEESSPCREPSEADRRPLDGYQNEDEDEDVDEPATCQRRSPQPPSAAPPPPRPASAVINPCVSRGGSQFGSRSEVRARRRHVARCCIIILLKIRGNGHRASDPEYSRPDARRRLSRMVLC